MKFTRILALVLALVMAFAFVACTNNKTDGNTPDDPSQGSNTPDTTPPDTDAPGGDGPVDETVYTPVDEYLKAMAASQYQVKANVKENIGLSDPDAVGVDEYRYRNEELYPVPADSEFAHIYNVADYGITPEATDNAAKLNQLLRDIKEVEGLKKISFPVGVYLMERTVSLDGYSDLYICCEDRTKNFELRLSGWFQGFAINNCENVHFNNFDFDYVDSPTISGEVLEVNPVNKEVVLKIFDEFDLTRPIYRNRGVRTYIDFKLDERGEWVPYNLAGGATFKSYDPETRKMVLYGASSNPLYYGEFSKIEVGARVSLSYTVYDYYGFQGGNNNGLYFENINVYAVTGMAFAFGGSYLYMNRVDLDLREGSKRLMTATADGWHLNGCPYAKVTNSTSMYSHDDSFNIKGAYYELTGMSGKTITYKGGAGAAEVGDKIDIYGSARFEYIGRFTVVEAESGKLKLDRVPEGAEAGCLFANDTKAPTFHLENSVMGNKRNRAMLVQCRRSIITGNTFKNYYHGTICIHTVRDQFKEGICPTDITITGNKFLNGTCGVSAGAFGTSGVASPGIFNNISVRNNFFYGTDPGVSMGYLGNSEVLNNLFYNVGAQASSPDSNCAVYVTNSINVKIENNISYHDTKDSRYKAVVESGNKGVEKSANRYYAIDQLKD